MCVWQRACRTSGAGMTINKIYYYGGTWKPLVWQPVSECEKQWKRELFDQSTLARTSWINAEIIHIIDNWTIEWWWSGFGWLKHIIQGHPNDQSKGFVINMANSKRRKSVGVVITVMSFAKLLDYHDGDDKKVSAFLKSRVDQAARACGEEEVM